MKKADSCQAKTLPSLGSRLINTLWNAWCIGSVVGIWPRFIEPRLISTTRLKLSVKELPPSLEGLKILQFSDLHLHPGIPDSFLKKILDKVEALAPDLIVYTGDFLCYAMLSDPIRLQKFLSQLKARYGCYAVLGNHDYNEYVTVNGEGYYDIGRPPVSRLKKAFGHLFGKRKIALGSATERINTIKLNPELMQLLATTNFTVLENETRLLSINGSYLNLCGLGEYTAGRLQPATAFKTYDKRYPGIILSHNPDSLPLLKKFPGEIVLCGHTHGGQVNLPWLWKRFTVIEHQDFKRGLLDVGGKRAYVNRGMGGVLTFRWFAMPELLLLTLQNHSSEQS